MPPVRSRTVVTSYTTGQYAWQDNGALDRGRYAERAFERKMKQSSAREARLQARRSMLPLSSLPSTPVISRRSSLAVTVDRSSSSLIPLTWPSVRHKFLLRGTIPPAGAGLVVWFGSAVENSPAAFFSSSSGQSASRQLQVSRGWLLLERLRLLG